MSVLRPLAGEHAMDRSVRETATRLQLSCEKLISEQSLLTQAAKAGFTAFVRYATRDKS